MESEDRVAGGSCNDDVLLLRQKSDTKGWVLTATQQGSVSALRGVCVGESKSPALRELLLPTTRRGVVLALGKNRGALGLFFLKGFLGFSIFSFS